MTDFIQSTHAEQSYAQSCELQHLSAVFYKKTKVSDIISKGDVDDGQRTGASTAGAEAHEQAQQHMAEIGDFMDFHEDDTDEENEIQEEGNESEASSISDNSDFEDEDESDQI